MRRIPWRDAFWLIARGTKNYYTRRPLTVSYEVTHSCTANCRHCDKGGLKEEPNRLQPGDYRRLQRWLKPMTVQLSGGEPLTRKDILEVVRAIKEPTGLPYLILVTNASLLTEAKYLELRAAGINQFSISLDFPDARHDDFRRRPGLFAHVSRLIPKLTAHGFDDVVVNTCITRLNLPYVRELYQRVIHWGGSISFSAYTSLRTGDSEFWISAEEDLALLKETLQDLIRWRRQDGRIANPEWTLTNMYDFFKNGALAGCNAGLRFLVVTPEGHLLPCSMQTERKWTSVKAMQSEFVPYNRCGQCYVSIRAYLDKAYWTLLLDNVKQRVLPQRRPRPADAD